MVGPLFHVEQPGFLTTVQDRGRVGWQRDGMVVAGVMDPFAAQVANILVGSSRGAAVLEITLRGPVLRALADTVVAVCGADLSARIDDLPLPLWRATRVACGQTIRFGVRRAGTRAYLAVTGGFDVSSVLGSRSTYLRGGLGGLQGHALRQGDELSGTLPALAVPASRGLAPRVVPRYETPTVVRVVAGPHGDAFADDAWAALTSQPYLVTPQSDRMGYRLDGARLRYAECFAGSILSEAMPLGGLQVPPSGCPVLLMADRQTVGGYPLIGVVVAADRPRVAQAGPGDVLVFQPVSAEEAEALCIAQERLLRLMAWAVGAGTGDVDMGNGLARFVQK